MTKAAALTLVNFHGFPSTTHAGKVQAAVSRSDFLDALMSSPLYKNNGTAVQKIMSEYDKP